MLQTTAAVGISTGRTKDLSASSRPGQHPRRRKSKDGGGGGEGGGGGGRTSVFWCTSGQRSPDSSFDATSSPYDIPHLVRPTSGCSDTVPPPPPPPPIDDEDDDDGGGRCSMMRKTESEDSGVHSGKEDASNSSSSTSSDHRLPPSGCSSSSSRPASASAVKSVQRTRPSAPVSNPGSVGGNEVAAVPRSRMFRSFSSFSLKTFSLRRSRGKRPTPENNNTSGGTGSSGAAAAATEVPNNPDRCSESSSTTSSNSSSSAVHQAVVLHGTASRGRHSSFKLSVSAPSFDSSSGNSPASSSSVPERCGARKSGCEFPASAAMIPAQLNLPDGVRLVKIFKLEQYVMNKWISGMVVSDKNELVLVDLRSAYLVDDWGNLIRTIGSKGSDRLVEPIGVSAGPEGRLVFSDHVQQNVKVFTNRGSHVRTVTDFSLANIAGVACDRATGEIFVAGTDRKRIFVHGGGGGAGAGGGGSGGRMRTIPKDNVNGGLQSDQVVFKHPFSVAYNPVSGEIIVGDDYDQSVMGVTKDGRLAWRFCPPTNDGERQFFPSSVCVDQLGTIFVADLYNGKVCMLDAGGQLVRVLLSRDFGLSGNPGAIATDAKGHIFVADEERTVKVFRYRKTS